MTWLLLVDWDEISRTVGIRGGRVLGVVIVVAVALLLIDRLFTPAIRAVMRRTSLGLPAEEELRIRTVTTVVHRTAWTVVIAIGFVTALSEFGVNIGPLLASAGIVGLAIGFGAQSLVRDAINGMFILLENQYAIGDAVVIAGKEGMVEDVNLRRTVLRDLDGAVHYIPNSQVGVASNLTRLSARLAATRKVDLKKAAAVIDDVGQELSRDPYFGKLMLAPPASIEAARPQDLSIRVTFPADLSPARQWEAIVELRSRIERRFERERIDLVFPRVIVARVPAPAPIVAPAPEPAGEEPS
ncbi:MAG TPA: mechanosensitive ion channel family protein [Dehalococcoidia bacterium]|nr:mechanosensitive ion channel family protein [Dehalococcoidia bacterium]